jgi:hypothetical protein
VFHGDGGELVHEGLAHVITLGLLAAA